MHEAEHVANNSWIQNLDYDDEDCDDNDQHCDDDDHYDDDDQHYDNDEKPLLPWWDKFLRWQGWHQTRRDSHS